MKKPNKALELQSRKRRKEIITKAKKLTDHIELIELMEAVVKDKIISNNTELIEILSNLEAKNDKRLDRIEKKLCLPPIKKEKRK